MTALLILNYAVAGPHRPAVQRRTAAPRSTRPARPAGSAPGGGELLASTNGTVRLHSGARPVGGTHTVVLRFRDARHARAAYDSAHYRDLLEERLAAAVPFSAVIVPELPTSPGRASPTGRHSGAVSGGTVRVPFPAAEAGPPPARMDLTDFVARAGLSARSIRAYHARGLLPPAERVGRRVFYGPEHVWRIASIQYLQRRGLNLEAILALSEPDPPGWHGSGPALPAAEDPLPIVAAVLDRPHGTADALARDLGARIAEHVESLRRIGCPPDGAPGAPQQFGPAVTALLVEAIRAVLAVDGAHPVQPGPDEPGGARTARCRPRSLPRPPAEPPFSAPAGAATRLPVHSRGSGTDGGPPRPCSPDPAERVGTSV
ncbi:MerR family transcriptional regulator [Kitasatospora sp. NPDC089797]|uniref:MerR family transcriptional regulator n=1 Tax=Kitasatospora sp. NPDC089797 TaxID=3155298 RepID=UPI003412A7D0